MNTENVRFGSCARYTQVVCLLYGVSLYPTWISHMRYTLCMCYIYHDSSCAIFLYRRVFDFIVSNVSTVSIVVAVGLSADTFVDTVTCPVSKISACIRYDG